MWLGNESIFAELVPPIIGGSGVTLFLLTLGALLDMFEAFAGDVGREARDTSGKWRRVVIGGGCVDDVETNLIESSLDFRRAERDRVADGHRLGND